MGAWETSITNRLIALIVAGAVVPLSFIHLTIYRSQQVSIGGKVSLADALLRLQETVAIETIVFIFLAIGLSIFVAQNLRVPLNEIILVLQRVKEGDFHVRAKVYSKDEIGYTGDRLNEMVEGLRERERIKNIFGSYVDRRIRDEILSGRISLDGELQEATVLFADLRDFISFLRQRLPKK